MLVDVRWGNSDNPLQFRCNFRFGELRGLWGSTTLRKVFQGVSGIFGTRGPSERRPPRQLACRSSPMRSDRLL